MKIDRFLYGFCMGVLLELVFHKDWSASFLFFMFALLIIGVDHFANRRRKNEK